jgi:hypothetical protein
MIQIIPLIYTFSSVGPQTRYSVLVEQYLKMKIHLLIKLSEKQDISKKPSNPPPH